MNNSIKINKLCRNIDDLLLSDIFLEYFSSIIGEVKYYNKDYIINIIKKIRSIIKKTGCGLNQEEKADIMEVFNNPRIKEKCSRLLSSFKGKKNFNIDVSIDELKDYIRLIESISGDDGYNKILTHIQKVSGIVSAISEGSSEENPIGLRDKDIEWFKGGGDKEPKLIVEQGDKVIHHDFRKDTDKK